MFYFLNIILSVVAPNLFIYLVNPLPSNISNNSLIILFCLVPALILLTISLIMTLKLISYSHVMNNLRSILIQIKNLKKEKKIDILVYIPDSDLDSAVIKIKKNKFYIII